jgi:hypothetical protein
VLTVQDPVGCAAPRAMTLRPSRPGSRGYPDGAREAVRGRSGGGDGGRALGLPVARLVL